VIGDGDKIGKKLRPTEKKGKKKEREVVKKRNNSVV
jgi:hypothetical protein